MVNVRQSWSRLQHHAQQVALRAGDRHIRLAVTGLSGAGKTAFVTALVNQLTLGYDKLPLFSVAREQRLIGVKRVMQPDLNIASFDYQGGIAQLTAEPPKWPSSTRNISELRLALRYLPTKGLRAKLVDSATLYLDIIDYPGEWLLDLPMLQLDFVQWSTQVNAAATKYQSSDKYDDFINSVNQLRLTDVADEQVLADISKRYQALLLDLVHQHGFYQAQPGRMLLPGELDGAPILSFFPLMTVSEQQIIEASKADKNSYFKVLQHRYQEYVQQVVKPFYRDHFCHFDRQVVLVDCLGGLNRGKDQFMDMTSALEHILESFQFGQNNLLKRLFSPKIDKLLFAASKVDHISRDQQANLLQLLGNMLKAGQQHARFDGCVVETMAISAIKASRHGTVNTASGPCEVVQGRVLDSGRPVTIFPGEVPTHLPDTSFWQGQGFDFPSFAPPIATNQLFGQIRMDHLLEFILGDKLL
ncbi:YcjX family protein [Shewanella sp. NIFS-20-20]|uniref:YcjX family protein n=1 Tax=Shewanella sp. NIFS-20-20 TaxID=2853806 RepID=UPI001C443D7D|nr:YcjX family protein [Shewanella sp. NIFS-20-20]MBV7315945.1 YcjX family protein [Shewanella sp. NIFS-20-20]